MPRCLEWEWLHCVGGYLYLYTRATLFGVRDLQWAMPLLIEGIMSVLVERWLFRLGLPPTLTYHPGYTLHVPTGCVCRLPRRHVHQAAGMAVGDGTATRYHHMLGHCHMVAHVYRQCKAAFRADLAIAPNEQTRQLVEGMVHTGQSLVVLPGQAQAKGCILPLANA